MPIVICTNYDKDFVGQKLLDPEGTIAVLSKAGVLLDKDGFAQHLETIFKKDNNTATTAQAPASRPPHPPPRERQLSPERDALHYARHEVRRQIAKCVPLLESLGFLIIGDKLAHIGRHRSLTAGKLGPQIEDASRAASEAIDHAESRARSPQQREAMDQCYELLNKIDKEAASFVLSKRPQLIDDIRSLKVAALMLDNDTGLAVSQLFTDTLLNFAVIDLISLSAELREINKIVDESAIIGVEDGSAPTFNVADAIGKTLLSYELKARERGL